MRHAAEAKLAHGRRVFGPGALDSDAVLEAVDAAARRDLRLVAQTERGVARAARNVVARRRGLVGVTLRRRAEHEVVQDVYLAHHAQVVRDVELGRDAEAQVGAGLCLVLAGELGVRCVVVAAHAGFVGRAQGRAAHQSGLADVVAVVRRHGPQRLARRIGTAEREVVEELRAHPEVTVELQDRSGMRPPVFGEDLVLGRRCGARATRIALFSERRGICARLRPVLKRLERRRTGSRGPGCVGSFHFAARLFTRFAGLLLDLVRRRRIRGRLGRIGRLRRIGRFGGGVDRLGGIGGLDRFRRVRRLCRGRLGGCRRGGCRGRFRVLRARARRNQHDGRGNQRDDGAFSHESGSLLGSRRGRTAAGFARGAEHCQRLFRPGIHPLSDRRSVLQAGRGRQSRESARISRLHGTP